MPPAFRQSLAQVFRRLCGASFTLSVARAYWTTRRRIAFSSCMPRPSTSQRSASVDRPNVAQHGTIPQSSACRFDERIGHTCSILQNIVGSRHFRASKRSQQFLEYVVEQKLQGTTTTSRSASGTYVPTFRRLPASRQVVSVALSEGELSLEPSSPPSNPESKEAGTAPRSSSSSVSARRPIRHFLLGAVLLFIGWFGVHYTCSPQQPDPVREFWEPLLASNKAVVIIFGKPAVYVPSRHFYDVYDEEHPGEFDLLYDRHNTFFPSTSRPA